MGKMAEFIEIRLGWGREQMTSPWQGEGWGVRLNKEKEGGTFWGPGWTLQGITREPRGIEECQVIDKISLMPSH